MTITVKLFATFRQGRVPVATREIEPGTAIDAIVSELGIRTADIGVIMVNGRHAELDQRLADRDVVAIFPVVGGG